MFTDIRYRRSALVVLCMLSLLTVSAPSARTDKKEKDKEKELVPVGKPILWRNPGNVRSLDLYWGQGGETMQPDLSRVTLIKEEKGGYSKKYRVRDGSGREWVAKIGKEAKGETAAVRLMWATGYFSDIDYLIPSVRVEGLNKPLQNARFSLRPKEVKRIDGWMWDQNPFVGSRQFQGLKVMMALLNNWDIKDSNNKVLVLRDRNDRNELHYMVGDLGGSFGKLSHIPRFLQFKPDRNNPKAYAKTRLVNKVKDGRVDFHYRLKKSYLMKDVTVDDAAWVANLLSRLSENQIRDAFRAANYSPEEVRLMTQGVQNRISELVSLRGALAERPRRSLEIRR